MFAVAIGREVALEGIDARPEDEVLRVINLAGDAKRFVADGGVLQFQIEQRNGHEGGVYPNAFASRRVSTAPNAHDCGRQARLRVRVFRVYLTGSIVML